MKFRLAITGLGFLLIAQTCNKKIALPNPELKKIFGKWEWVETSGGFAGKIITPAKAGYTEEIEFTSQGIFQEFKDGKLKDKKGFSIISGKSILKEDLNYIIYFTMIDSLFPRPMQKQSLSLKGSDTLLLNEECLDCFSSVWVRKK
jgi:hypothetical protein